MGGKRLGWVVTALTLCAALFTADGATAAARYTGSWRSQKLGDFVVGPNRPILGQWQASWNCKEAGCARGEARAISRKVCLTAPCARLRIYDDRNASRDSVGFRIWRDNDGGDGYGKTYEGQGTESQWRWKFRFGRGFPTRRSERQYVNITEWHATGFNAPGHPLVINAQLGQIHATSYGWDGRRNAGRSAWSCMLARSYKRGVWYKIRVDVRWSAFSDAYMRVRFGVVGDRRWHKTCIRDDGFGNLFMDPNGRPDEIYMAQNLYRNGVYKRDMVVYFDKTRQIRSS